MSERNIFIPEGCSAEIEGYRRRNYSEIAQHSEYADIATQLYDGFASLRSTMSVADNVGSAYEHSNEGGIVERQECSFEYGERVVGVSLVTQFTGDRVHGFRPFAYNVEVSEQDKDGEVLFEKSSAIYFEIGGSDIKVHWALSLDSISEYLGAMLLLHQGITESAPSKPVFTNVDAVFLYAEIAELEALIAEKNQLR